MACSKPLPKDRELRLILTGLTGVGKSSFGNVLHGLKCYKTSHGFASETKKCELCSSDVDGYLVTTIDTPGFYDTNSNFDFDSEMENCITLSLPGPHVIVYIIPLRCRFTQEHFDVLEKFIEKFGDNVQKYFFLVLTYFDEYKKHNKSSNFNLELLLQDLNPKYKTLLQNTFGDRYFPFDNTVTGSDRVEQIVMLLQKLTKTVETNDNKHYTNSDFKTAALKKQQKDQDAERRIQLGRRDLKTSNIDPIGLIGGVYRGAEATYHISKQISKLSLGSQNTSTSNRIDALKSNIILNDMQRSLSGNISRVLPEVSSRTFASSNFTPDLRTIHFTQSMGSFSKR